MAKPIWVINGNYVRNNLSILIEAASNPDELKIYAEKRMAFYDAQPVLVRKCINENGMGNGKHFKDLKTTKEKCDAIRDMRQKLYQKTSFLLTD
jgi:hypothetical protein